MTAYGMTPQEYRAKWGCRTTEIRRDAEGACQGNRPWPEAGTRSGAKAEAARGKEEGSLSLVTIEVCVEKTGGLVATWVRDSGRVGAAARADDHARAGAAKRRRGGEAVLTPQSGGWRRR